MTPGRAQHWPIHRHDGDHGLVDSRKRVEYCNAISWIKRPNALGAKLLHVASRSRVAEQSSALPRTPLDTETMNSAPATDLGKRIQSAIRRCIVGHASRAEQCAYRRERYKQIKVREQAFQVPGTFDFRSVYAIEEFSGHRLEQAVVCESGRVDDSADRWPAFIRVT